LIQRRFVRFFNLVKGEEVDKTHYFLQSFHKAATNGKDNSKFIQKYLEIKKKKADEKKNRESAKPEDKKEAPKQVEKQQEPKKETVKEQPKSVEKKPESSKESKTEQPKVDKNASSTKSVASVRPGTGKKPERILEPTKEVTEEANKAPQGLISEKGKKEEKVKHDEDMSSSSKRKFY
jgi:hypothetical protein